MCYSARASFVASGVLLAAGVGTLSISSAPGATALAATPIVYSAHQFIEGLLWLTGPGRRWPRMNALASYAFLVVALMVWPVYVPFALYRLEAGHAVGPALLAMCVAGCVLAAYLAYVVLRTRLPTVAVDRHIVFDTYVTETRARYLLVRGTYVVLTSVPYFLGRGLWLPLYCVGMVAGFGHAMWRHRQSLTSVWCFSAAVLSAALLLILPRL